MYLCVYGTILLTPIILHLTCVESLQQIFYQRSIPKLVAGVIVAAIMLPLAQVSSPSNTSAHLVRHTTKEKNSCLDTQLRSLFCALLLLRCSLGSVPAVLIHSFASSNYFFELLIALDLACFSPASASLSSYVLFEDNPKLTRRSRVLRMWLYLASWAVLECCFQW